MEPLSPEEARVVAALVEKQRTVPDTYPLTLNALVAACNQTSNRDPVVSYDDATVLATIDSLKAKGLARMVHPSAGSRATKYRQVLGDALGIEDDRLAVLAVLLLRGPQTLAELRSRTERLWPFESTEEVESALAGLADAGHVERLERRPGEREARWRQLLAPDAHASGHGSRPQETRSLTRTLDADDPGLRERVAALEAEVAELRAVVDRLRQVLE